MPDLTWPEQGLVAVGEAAGLACIRADMLARAPWRTRTWYRDRLGEAVRDLADLLVVAGAQGYGLAAAGMVERHWPPTAAEVTSRA